MNVLITAGIVANFISFMDMTADDPARQSLYFPVREKVGNLVGNGTDAFRLAMTDAMATIAREHSGEERASIERFVDEFLAADGPSGEQADPNLQTARIIAEILVFFDTTDEENEVFDPDDMIEYVENMQIDDLDLDYLQALVDALAVITPEYEGEALDRVDNIVYDFGLLEVLAGDDQERVAAIDAEQDRRLATRTWMAKYRS